MKKSKKIIILISTLIVAISLLATISYSVAKRAIFANVDILSIDDLCEMNTNEPMEFEYNSSGYIKRIDGNCANFKVYNRTDALKVVYGLQEILSVCDINDLRFYKEDHNLYNDIYMFKQYNKGIAVNSGVVTVLVDTKTKDTYIVNSNCVPDLNIASSHKITKSEAKKIIKDKFNVNRITKIELKIYDDIEKGNVLAWYIETNSYDAPFIYLDANTGEILYYDSPRID